MEHYTFGNSKAAVNLMTTLQREEYAHCGSKVASVLGKFFQSTGAIIAMPDRTTREAVLGMWHAKFVERIAKLDIPEVIKTHTLCVLKTRYRQCVEEVKDEYKGRDNKDTHRNS